MVGLRVCYPEFESVFLFVDGLVTGCVAISACSTPSEASEPGYVITERNLTGPGFNVSVACAPGYGEAPLAVVCSTEGGSYGLSGCSGTAYEWL